MIKRNILFVVGICILFFSVEAYAEIIHLKNGRKIKGKVTYQSDNEVHIDAKGIPLKYYMEQVEKIVKEEDVKLDAVAQDAGIPLEVAALAKRLIIANGTKQRMRVTLDQIRDRAPSDQQEMLNSIFDVDEITDRLVPIFAKYFTEEELQSLVDFYESPAGKKLMESQVAILTDTITVSTEYFKEKTQEMQGF